MPTRPLSSTIAIDERLTLELLDERHIPAIHALVAVSRAELLPWMPWAADTEEAAYRAFVTRVLTERTGPLATGGAAYAILIDGAYAGCVDLHGEIPEQRSAAIGYWLGTPYTGHGWMTQSVVALTEIGFADLGLQRIEIHADVDNVRSRRVAERAGFTLASIRPNPQSAHHGRDEAVYLRTSPLAGG
jgi:ribosomal-protein-serine acetyltransferase